MSNTIKLTCLKTEYIGTEKYLSVFTHNDKKFEIELNACPVVGTEYELLIKGLWGGSGQQLYLNDIDSIIYEPACLVLSKEMK